MSVSQFWNWTSKQKLHNLLNVIVPESKIRVCFVVIVVCFIANHAHFYSIEEITKPNEAKKLFRVFFFF